MSESAIKANYPDLRSPDITYQADRAFYPLRIDPSDKKIKPSYQSTVCTKKFIICTKWEKKTLFFEDLGWFLSNGFGLYKQPDL